MKWITHGFVAACLLAGGVEAADEKPGKPEAPTEIVLRLDASKLPPELLKQLLAAAALQQRKTLTEAIAVAEKHAGGSAQKAAVTDDGFVVEVKTDRGTATVRMDAQGNVAGGKGGMKSAAEVEEEIQRAIESDARLNKVKGEVKDATLRLEREAAKHPRGADSPSLRQLFWELKQLRTAIDEREAAVRKSVIERAGK